MSATSSAGRKAWITLVTRPDYVPGLLTVNYTLRAVSSYPLLVMATDGLPESSRRIIKSQGLEIIDVDHLSPAAGQHPGFDPTFVRLNDAWTKLQVFGLTQYDRLVLIDSDMIFTRGMDEIFDVELPGDDWIGGAPACVCNPFKIDHYPSDWTPENCQLLKQSRYAALNDPPIPALDGPRTGHLLNSGMVVLKPKVETLNHIKHFLDTSPLVAEAKFADQDVIAEAFKGRWKPLAWWSNALKPGRAAHPEVWADEEVRLIHYILEKPWNERPESAKAYEGIFPVEAKAGPRQLPTELVDLVKNSGSQQSLTCYDEVHAWWWVAYEAMLAELKAGGEEGGWQEIEAYVKR